jgi:hypothetical protein
MGLRTGDEVRLVGHPAARGRVVKILGYDLIRVYWLVHPTHPRRWTIEHQAVLDHPDPQWVDPSGRRCPTVPCAHCGRTTPLYRMRGAELWRRWDRKDWRPFQVEEYPSWCGHPQARVYLPEGTGWWREVPVMEATPNAAGLGPM